MFESSVIVYAHSVIYDAYVYIKTLQPFFSDAVVKIKFQKKYLLHLFH